jgi:hypothetical protein
MKINLNGKTQEDVEMMFSTSSLLETIKANAEIFISRIDDEYFDKISEIIDGNDAEEIMLYIVGIIANPTVFSKELDSGIRLIQTNSVIKALGYSRFMQNNYPDLEEAFHKSIDIIFLLDGILFDIAYHNVKLDDGEYRKVAHCEIGFNIDELTAIAPELEFFKFPLIEQPKDWNEYDSGGYHLNNTKPTLNRGADFEPQETLNVLNILQHNKMKLTNDAQLEPLQEYMIDKLMKKYDFHFAESIVRNTTKSADLVFKTMQDREFYLEWKFDFRGRIYSTGYDINLQGDKFRKGIITPVIEGRVTIC